eukprot:2881258-Rhodomonas_salina.1
MKRALTVQKTQITQSMKRDPEACNRTSDGETHQARFRVVTEARLRERVKPSKSNVSAVTESKIASKSVSEREREM